MSPLDELAANRPPSDGHIVGVFDTDAFLAHTVANFARPSLDARGLTVLVLRPDRRAIVAAQLHRDGVDVEEAVRRGELVVVDSLELAQQLTGSGVVDVAAFHAATSGVFGLAAERRCALRIAGDLGAVLWQAGQIGAVLELEELWNRVADAPPFDLLCVYPARAFAGTQPGQGHGHAPAPGLGVSQSPDDPTDAFIALCERHLEVRPVEDQASLVGPGGERRAVALLEHHDRASTLHRARLAAQDAELRAIRARAAQQHAADQDDFAQALAGRDVIGEAKGILMVRWRLDEDGAFAMLRDASNRSNRKLRDVARTVVDHQLRRN